MREIKFRVWDKINKKWIKNFNIDLLNIDVSELPNIEIMQYTGLNDKNGKEIYEGDIVEVDATTTTDWEKHRTEDTGDNHLTFVEVIGNIYENLELLEE